MSLEARLNALSAALLDPKLLRGRGLGNEIGFYIFDYPPERDPDVARALPQVVRTVESEGVQVAVVNLYRTVLGLLEARGYLDKALALEEARGPAALHSALKPLLTPEKVADAVAQEAQGAGLVLLTQVGAAYPLLRSHSILNNLHERLDQVPVVMFFPGTYDGQQLRLFGLFKDDNYYRAFRLLPEAKQGASA
ncbi:DUF1788 domain-containing protein [Deinococcus sp. MIMF12]|uniref:DUF1788 domain-containing protein n=1 Tax=Deinococcus rhizophilus TaxID=3049544 RepID=A0ABT7JED8_9DEIO|nr:DUF1788 domain-containing protein [Deinococcus rhizophilus]MDL2342843.1 DUF1788 domain-containing protein [Deinococcus rhizophilus]